MATTTDLFARTARGGRILRASLSLLALSALGLSVPAFAQDTTEDTPEDNTATRPPVAPAPAPENTASPDPKPTAPSPEVPNPAQDVKTYAGVGSNTAYAERGVAELGGSLSLATANGTSSIAVEPSFGYFFFDNVELSGVLSVRHVSISGANANQVALIAEPSVHFPINDGLFLFGGLGVGAALYDTSATSVDTGFLVAPRAGVQLLLGRSGLLNLAVRYSGVLSSLDGNVDVGGGQTVLAFQNQLDLQGGYTIMF